MGEAVSGLRRDGLTECIKIRGKMWTYFDIFAPISVFSMENQLI
jgi:hypothetical protein